MGKLRLREAQRLPQHHIAACFFTTARTQYSLFPKLSHVSSASLSALPFLILPHKLEMSIRVSCSSAPDFVCLYPVLDGVL